MQTFTVTLQLAVALGLLNVWLLRYNQRTAYRGGEADSMREEFAAYGLPGWLVYVVGTLKVGSALALIAGIWLPAAVLPAAGIVTALMLGAVAMHIKIGDQLLKSVPAFVMLALCLGIIWGSTG